VHVAHPSRSILAGGRKRFHALRLTQPPLQLFSAICFPIVRPHRCARSQNLSAQHLSFCCFRQLGKHTKNLQCEFLRALPEIFLKLARCPRSLAATSQLCLLCRSSHSLHSSDCILLFYFGLFRLPNS